MSVRVLFQPIDEHFTQAFLALFSGIKGPVQNNNNTYLFFLLSYLLFFYRAVSIPHGISVGRRLLYFYLMLIHLSVLFHRYLGQARGKT